MYHLSLHPEDYNITEPMSVMPWQELRQFLQKVTGAILVPTIFKKGDLNWMMRQREYKTHFFIYIDNEQAIHSNRSENAFIFRDASPPRAWSILRGLGGKRYAPLDNSIQQRIERDIAQIVLLCREHGYTNVHY